MGVSLNGGTPKSSILIRFSIINHPFWGPTPILGNIHIIPYGHLAFTLHRSPKWPLSFWKQHRLQTVQMRGGEAQFAQLQKTQVLEHPFILEQKVHGIEID